MLRPKKRPNGLSKLAQLKGEDLPHSMRTVPTSKISPDQIKTLVEVERDYILDVVRATDSNKRLVATKLGISPSSPYRKLNEYGANI